MKRIFMNKYIIVICICIIGFSIGFVCHELVFKEVDASNKIDSEQEVREYTDIFSEDLYVSTYNDKSKIVHITKKNGISKEKTNKLYSKVDAKKLADEMLHSEYELRLTDETDYGLSYEEYKDGYPTGGLASYVFDEEGNIVEARFREGTIYEFDEDTMISYEEAYVIAIKAIIDKYGADVDIEGDSSDYEYRIYYRPASEDLCYEIIKVVGHIPDMVESGIDPVYFYITVSKDGTFVEVASSLGY